MYAKGALSKDGGVRVLILDGDMKMQNTAARNGFYPTQDKECDAVYPIDMTKIRYSLPDGYTITSLAETYDLYKYGRVLWKGFNHEVNGEGAFSPGDEYIRVLKMDFERPNVNLNLKVATDPACRKMGLGRAAVLEAVTP